MILRVAGFSLTILSLWAAPAWATAINFSTGSPNGVYGVASQPSPEIEAADDFNLLTNANITGASFIGLLPSGANVSTITEVDVEFYRLFPLDSDTVRTITVPTRVNSPADNDFAATSSTDGSLTFVATVLSSSFSAGNSVLNGINPLPNQTTGGEGPISGEEVQIDVTFPVPVGLPADHYFIDLKVGLSNGTFFWLSVPNPAFSGDLQAWIRNAALDPDWLRIGTDIIGGTTPPIDNLAFSITGVTVPEPATFGLLGVGLAALGLRRLRRGA